jgi:hypothetical protein
LLFNLQVKDFYNWSDVPMSLAAFKNDMVSRNFPTETSFGAEITPYFSPSATAVMKLEGGTDDAEENAGQENSLVQFGMTYGNGGQHAQKPIQHSNTFHSGCNNPGLDDASPAVDCDRFHGNLSHDSPHAHYSNSRQPRNRQPHVRGNSKATQQTTSIANPQHVPSPSTSAIATMFARQRIKPQANVLVSNNVLKINEKSDNLDASSRPNKRARDQKIRL